MQQGRVLVLGVVVAVLGFAAPAQAGTYRVWTCQTPDGQAAPIRDAASGWTSSLRPDTQFMLLADRCGSGGGIHARLAGPQLRATGGQWTFVPPAGTSLGGYSITWSGTVTGGGEATLARSDKPDPDYPDRNGASFGTKTIAERGFDIASVTALVARSFVQSGQTCPSDPIAEYSISRAVMTLNDFSAPIASGVSGDLVSAATLRGPASVSFTAKDSGGGVYRVVVTADGKDVGSALVPDSSGRCVQVDPADANSFKWPQPCPLEVGTTVSLDTATLPEGTRSIGVLLEDAAGNRTTLAPPAVRTVVHRGTPNGGDVP